MTRSPRRVPDRVSDPRRSQALFEQFVLPEIEVMLRVARSLTRNDADAEDLVQDTLIRAYRAIERFDGRHPRAWLLTILRNTHINRNRRRRPELMRDPDGTSRELHEVPSLELADASVDAGFDAEVERALAELDEPFRRVVELVDVSGLTYAEAAEVLGVPTGTVMSRLHRGRARIRDRLDRAGLAPRSHS
ncbi:MAG: sigma-70 family RNA polymerase sigma factor [Acidimicrobiaceae bacterium]|nr:sigma-70 family RNA polymerase sigma factor [Acidimicrobiaceae bacterium]